MYYETFGKRFRNIAHAEMKGNCNMWLNLCLCILTRILDVHYKLNFEKKKKGNSTVNISRIPMSLPSKNETHKRKEKI